MIKMEPGQEFGKWTVISVEDSKKAYCRCKCGNERWIYRQSLKEGLSKGCQSCKKQKIKNEH